MDWPVEGQWRGHKSGQSVDEPLGEVDWLEMPVKGEVNGEAVGVHFLIFCQ